MRFDETIKHLCERNAKLVAALEAVIRDINDYERENKLAPNPGRTECWDSVARAKALLLQQSPEKP